MTAVEPNDVIVPPADVISALWFRGYHADDVERVFATGRPERARNATYQWMMKNSVPGGILMMRKDGDHREDTVVKKEFMDELLANGHRIAGVFEDRPSVVRVWREMGLTVFQMTHKEF